MSDPRYHDRHTAGIYRAIALRFYCRYVDMRGSAEHVGGDVANHGPLPTPRDAADQDTAAIDEWLFESPDSAAAPLSLGEFAGVITAAIAESPPLSFVSWAVKLRSLCNPEIGM